MSKQKRSFYNAEGFDLSKEGFSSIDTEINKLKIGIFNILNTENYTERKKYLMAEEFKKTKERIFEEVK